MYKSKLVPIAKIADENERIYSQIHSTAYNQVFVYNILPGEKIGPKVLPYRSLFLQVVSGKGRVFIDSQSQPIGPEDVVNIAAGFEYEIRNEDETEPLKLFSVYSPPLFP